MKFNMIDYLNYTENIDLDKLKEISQIIKKGGIVVFPTETVYGIGTNGLNIESISRLYKVKQRPINKPISLLVSSIEMVNMVAKDITDMEYKLMNKFFPGPLTIILKKKSIVPDNLTNNTDTVGIRMPDNIIAKKLIEYSNAPIATSSANISGKTSGTDINNIIEDFKDKVDYYIDGGKSKLGIGSTIVKIEGSYPIILREGSISKEQIIECLKIKL